MTALRGAESGIGVASERSVLLAQEERPSLRFGSATFPIELDPPRFRLQRFGRRRGRYKTGARRPRRRCHRSQLLQRLSGRRANFRCRWLHQPQPFLQRPQPDRTWLHQLPPPDQPQRPDRHQLPSATSPREPALSGWPSCSSPMIPTTAAWPAPPPRNSAPRVGKSSSISPSAKIGNRQQSFPKPPQPGPMPSTAPAMPNGPARCSRCPKRYSANGPSSANHIFGPTIWSRNWELRRWRLLQLGLPLRINAAAELAARYEEHFGAAPHSPYFANAYDAYQLLLDAVLAAGELDEDRTLHIDRTALNAAIRGTSDYPASPAPSAAMRAANASACRRPSSRSRMANSSCSI